MEQTRDKEETYAVHQINKPLMSSLTCKNHNITNDFKASVVGQMHQK